jgi:hypothetical protein
MVIRSALFCAKDLCILPAVPFVEVAYSEHLRASDTHLT